MLGTSRYGQMGLGPDTKLVEQPRIVPIMAADGHEEVVEAVMSGQSYTIVLCASGRLYGCGMTKSGCLLSHRAGNLTSFTLLDTKPLPPPDKARVAVVSCGDKVRTYMHAMNE